MPGEWRVAIIGAGIGAQHMDAFQTLPDRFDVAAICDLEEDRARAVIPRGCDTRYMPRFDAVLADPGIDVVDICLPPHLHVPAALAALEAGKHVICEKPLATSLAEVDRLEAASRAAGRMVFPVFQYRFGPAARQLRALIDAGLAGRLLVATLETHWNRGADYYASPWRGTWAGERGGAILGHAIHIHDLLSFALGPVARVQAELATRINEIETEDCAALAIRMENGAPVTSSVTLGSARDETRLRFVFEGVTAESGRTPYAPAQGRWEFTARASVQQDEVDAIVGRADTGPVGYGGLFTAVADALDGRPGDEVTLAHGRRSVEFVTAVYAAARSGKAEVLPILSGHALYDGWLPG